MTRRLARASLLTALIALIMTPVFLNMASWYSADTFFLLETGRWIIEHGIPHENPWSAVPGAAIVVQQWAHDVMLYGLYRTLGPAGPSLLSAVGAAALAWSVHGALAVFGGGPVTERLELPAISLVIGFTGLAFRFLVPRPTIWTMPLALATATACGAWARGGSRRPLAALPLIMLAHMQVHMAMAWLDALIAAAWLAPWGASELSSLRTRAGLAAWARSRAPLALAIAGMCAASLANPYGLDGALYLLNSYGAAGYRGLISEMRPVWSFGPRVLLLVLPALILSLPAAVRAARRGTAPWPLLVILAGALVAGATSVRSLWMPVVLAVPLWGCALGRPNHNCTDEGEPRAVADN